MKRKALSFEDIEDSEPEPADVDCDNAATDEADGAASNVTGVSNGNNPNKRKTVDWYKSNEGWWKPIKSGEFRNYYQNHYKLSYANE